MATTVETTRPRRATADPETRIVLHGISWATYESLAKDMADRHVRLTYDRGVLELMSPSPLHERLKKLLGRLVEDILFELRIPFEPGGESRLTREVTAWGLEPDDCYFLAAEKLAVLRGRPADRPDDPPPDLAIEVDLGDPATDRPSIYATLGVAEVWRYDGERPRIEALRDDGTFEERPNSQFLPVRADEIGAWIRRAESTDFLTWLDRLHDWIRNELAPRQRGGGRGD